MTSLTWGMVRPIRTDHPRLKKAKPMLLKSPCLNCKEIGPDRDKDNDTCRQCGRRIAYANAVEGKTTADCILSPLPARKDEENPMPPQSTIGTKPGQQTEPSADQERTCPRCKLTKKVNSINFNRHAKGPGGFSRICKQCFKASIRLAVKSPAKKTGRQVETPSQPTAPPNTPYERQVVYIDFSKDPELHKQFIELCQRQDRPPEFQALHIIRNACNQSRTR